MRRSASYKFQHIQKIQEHPSYFHQGIQGQHLEPSRPKPVRGYHWSRFKRSGGPYLPHAIWQGPGRCVHWARDAAELRCQRKVLALFAQPAQSWEPCAQLEFYLWNMDDLWKWNPGINGKHDVFPCFSYNYGVSCKISLQPIQCEKPGCGQCNRVHDAHDGPISTSWGIAL